MKPTLIIIDQGELEEDEDGFFYTNGNGKRITPSATSTVTYLKFGSYNVTDLLAQIALLKLEIRRLK